MISQELFFTVALAEEAREATAAGTTWLSREMFANLAALGDEHVRVRALGEHDRQQAYVFFYVRRPASETEATV